MEESDEFRTRGNTALKEGKIDEAIQHFTEGIEKYNDDVFLLSNRSAAYGSKGEWGKALEDAQRATEIRPQWGKAHSRLALALFKLNRYEESIKAYNQALSCDPSNTELSTNIRTVQNTWKASEQHVLGEEYLVKGKANQALPFLEEAVKLDPNSALYWSNLSNANLQLGNFEKALNDAEHVIRLRPTWHKGYQRKGEALHKLQRYKDSAATYAIGLQIDPTNEQLNSGFSKSHCLASSPSNVNQNSEEESIFSSTVKSVKNFFGY